MLAPDFQKSINIYNGLYTGYQALDWCKTVNSVANLNRWPDLLKLQSVSNPISLLTRELIPNNVNLIKSLKKHCNFSGINGTKLEVCKC